MSDEAWLWDRSGPPDPTVEALEAMLSRYAHGKRATPRRRAPLPLAVSALLVAALLVAALFVVVWSLDRGEVTKPLPTGEFVVVNEDAPDRPLDGGAWCEPKPRAQRLRIGELGWVELAPGARVRVDDARRGFTRLFLESGRIEASIDPRAGARVFQVATPAVLCIDLGCRYVLEHDATSGEATVSVTLGRVAFASQGREVFVPWGASCRAGPGDRLGTPCFDDLEPGLKKLCARYDELSPLEPARRELVAKFGSAVERRLDTLVLWHWLADADPEVVALAERALIRLAGLPPDALAQKQITGIDRETWRAHVEALWWR
ncbi:MAG: hypothetical protein HZB39_21335 [Planctomycetes bacterium]|nr:hypothetical protein [Planctomycetota bacterium]